MSAHNGILCRPILIAAVRSAGRAHERADGTELDVALVGGPSVRAHRLSSHDYDQDDKRAVAHVGIEQATGSDRGDAIVSAVIEHLRERLQPRLVIS
jgi:hypothetical protein